MSDLGPVRRYLGLQIERSDGGYILQQTDYINSMLNRYGMRDAYEAPTPPDNQVTLDISGADEDSLISRQEYLALVGSLMYTAFGGRPDISFAVSHLSRFNTDTRSRHLTAVKKGPKIP